MIRLGQDVPLQLNLLRNGFHYKISIRQRRHIRDRKHASQHIRLLSRLQLSFLDFAVEVLCNSIDSAIQKSLLNVAQQHLVTGTRKNVRDAITHGASAKHSHSSDGINRQAAASSSFATNQAN